MTSKLTVPKPPKRPEFTSRDGWIDTADVARIIRYRLKCLYPRTHFYVRISRYAGGSSIRVTWTDGPPSSEIEPIVKAYASSRFDGSIDLGYSVSSWLRTHDLAAFVRHNPGSQGSGGYDPGYKSERPEGCIPVRFGSGYVFADRDYSRAAYERAVAETGANGLVKDSYGGGVYFHGETRYDDERVWRWLREQTLPDVKR